MHKTLYRWKILISDFFNKIPTIILIPGILLGSFLAAILLIWSGMKMAPVEIREPFENNSNTNARKRSVGDKNNNLEGMENPGENHDSYNNSSANLDSNANADLDKTGSNGQNSGTNQLNDNLHNSNPTNQGNSTVDNSEINTDRNQESEGRSSSQSTSATTSSSSKSTSSYGTSTSTNSSAYGNSTSGNCIYPEGDVELWWRRATKKQRDCYITKNGFPDFFKNSPYFCDYDNNDDCYIR